jgi:predicted nucleotidyltransferase
VEAVCRKHGVSRLVAFGSRVRPDRAPGSDLDLVARLPPGSTLFDLMDLEDELQAVFGCKVDLGSTPDPDSRLARHLAEEGVILVPQPALKISSRTSKTAPSSGEKRKPLPKNG